jgi:hypothetical protein
MRLGFRLLLCLFLSGLLGPTAPARADGPSRQSQLKAAFIYNFTQFVEWPPDAFAGDDSPFVVAVVGDDPLQGALEAAMADKTAGARPIIVKHFASVDDLGPCQLLFVPASQDGSLGAILKRIGTSPVLTVGESDAFMPAGGAIRLFLENGKMRFELDPDVCDAARLKVSAKLMKLARIYRR